MTGNTKVWRAPLAGLASVAMIATMGVAASTANAAATATLDETKPVVTLKTDEAGGKFITADGKKTDTVQFQDADQDGNVLDELKTWTADTDSVVSVGSTKFVFSGWYEEGSHTAWDPTQDLTADVTLEAHYAQLNDYVNVKFPKDGKTVYAGDFYNDGTYNEFNLASDDVVADWQAAFADDATNPGDHYVTTGYEYDGNALDLAGKTGQQLVDTISPRPDPNADQKVIQLGNSYKENDEVAVVTFAAPTGWSYNGQHVFDVIKGQKVAPIEAEGAENYRTSTYTNEVNGQTWNFDDPVNVDLTLIPDSSASTKYYTVTYRQDSVSQKANALKTDSNAVDEQVVAGGAAKNTAAPAAAKSGYEFLGWSTTDYALTTLRKDVKLADLTAVKNDVTVYAVYAPKTVTVTYEYGYGAGNKTYTTQSYAENDVFKAPADPTRDGYAFTAWSPALNANKQRLHLSLGGGLFFYADSATGDGAQTDAPVALSALTYTAAWEKADAASLKAIEDRVPVKYLKPDDTNYRDGDDEGQVYFTADSFDQYVQDWQTYEKDKAAKGDLSQNEIAELITELSGFQAKLVETGTAPVYRAYNTNDGDHYYTISETEYKGLVKIGWNAEGNKFDAVETRDQEDDPDIPANLGEAIYSVYNPNTGEHLLVGETEAQDLKDLGWNWDNKEKPVFYAPQNGSVATYRIYNPNTEGPAHAYVDQEEGANVVKLGWKWDNSGSPVYHFD